MHLAEDRAVLDGQLIERQVRGAEVQRAVQLVAPGGKGLVLAGIDQVDADTRSKVDSCATRIAVLASSTECIRPRRRRSSGSRD